MSALALAFAWPLQGVGFNQNSHYALVKSLARGTAVVDETVHEVGDLGTADVTELRGHLYSNKAPGLAFSLLPVYLGLRELGLQTVGPAPEAGYSRRLWQLTLFGAVLPAVALMLLTLVAVERVRPGFGAMTATLLGAGTLLLPFATLLFGHVLSATLGFAAFVVLLLERERGPSAWSCTGGPIGRPRRCCASSFKSRSRRACLRARRNWWPTARCRPPKRGD